MKSLRLWLQRRLGQQRQDLIASLQSLAMGGHDEGYGSAVDKTEELRRNMKQEVSSAARLSPCPSPFHPRRFPPRTGRTSRQQAPLPGSLRRPESGNSPPSGMSSASVPGHPMHPAGPPPAPATPGAGRQAVRRRERAGAQGTVLHEYHYWFFCIMLLPAQQAACEVASFPFFPDPMGLRCASSLPSLPPRPPLLFPHTPVLRTQATRDASARKEAHSTAPSCTPPCTRSSSMTSRRSTACARIYWRLLLVLPLFCAAVRKQWVVRNSPVCEFKVMLQRK